MALASISTCIRLGAAALLALLALFAAPTARAVEGSADLTVLRDGTHASGLVAGAGGSLWFTGHRSRGENVLGRVDASGAVSEVPLGPAAAAGGRIAAAADGSLWFTESAASRLGRLRPGGAVEQLSAPSGPGAIATAPGGAVWFVEEGSDRVGRADPSGGVTEYPLSAGARPTGIAVGPDGGIWVVEQGLARIARLAPSGTLTASYALPDPASRPYAIVAGPDEALWFSDESAPRIGRIATSGVIEEFPVPSEDGTRELVLGADGNLWFTSGYAIGSIAPDGRAGEPACVTSACDLPVTALARGGDGGLWFATGYRVLRGSNAQALAESGFVGRFSPPLPQVRIGRSATRVRDGLTTVAISCHGGAADDACRGWLRLSAKLGGRRLTLDRHRYLLAPATSRRLPLLVGLRGRRALDRAARLRVQVSASLTAGGGARRNFVLQARARR